MMHETLEDKEKLSNKDIFELLLPALFGGYLAVLIWVTLLSRIGSGVRCVYPPLWSYRAFIDGNIRAGIENVENILLFIPLGVFLRCYLKNSYKRIIDYITIILIGIIASLSIECLQWLFWLGSFEIDDIIHNTLGAVIGWWIIGRFSSKNRFSCSNDISKSLSHKTLRRTVMLTLTSILIFVSLPFVFQTIRHQQMIKYAAMNNREDGTENLLIMNGYSGYVGETDVYVKYLKDGSIRIYGDSNQRAWKRLADLELEAGNYTFTGLSDTAENSIAIELEYYDKKIENFIRLTPDVGPVSLVTFQLTENTKIRAYVGVYDGGQGDYIARPAIYKEE